MCILDATDRELGEGSERGVRGGSPMQGWVQQYLTSNESSGMLQLHLLDGLVTSGTHELQSHYLHSMSQR